MLIFQSYNHCHTRICILLGNISLIYQHNFTDEPATGTMSEANIIQAHNLAMMWIYHQGMTEVLQTTPMQGNVIQMSKLKWSRFISFRCNLYKILDLVSWNSPHWVAIGNMCNVVLRPFYFIITLAICNNQFHTSDQYKCRENLSYIESLGYFLVI